MRVFLSGLAELLPVSLIPYLFLGAGLLVTAFCFALAFLFIRR